MSIEVRIDDYRFFGFGSQEVNHIVFEVESFYGQELGQKDLENIRKILEDLGKWETIVRGGLILLSELKISKIDQSTLQAFDKSFGAKLYKFDVDMAKGSYNYRCKVVSYLTAEERHKREDRRTNLAENSNLLKVEEISSQVCNIAKWVAFKKMLVILGF